MRRAWRWESLGSETDETLTQGEHSLQIHVEWPSSAFVTDWDLFSLVGKLCRGGRSHYHRYSHPIMRICPENKSNSVAWQSFSIWPECLIFIWFMWPKKKKKNRLVTQCFFFLSVKLHPLWNSSAPACWATLIDGGQKNTPVHLESFLNAKSRKNGTLASFPLWLWWW